MAVVKQGKHKNSQGKMESYGSRKLLADINTISLNYFGTKKNIMTFLQHIISTSSVAASADKMKFHPLEMYEVIDQDERLHDLVNRSLAAAKEKVEAILHARLLEGDIEQVYKANHKMGERVKYSSKNMIDYLKGKENLRERRIVEARRSADKKDNLFIDIKEF